MNRPVCSLAAAHLFRPPRALSTAPPRSLQHRDKTPQNPTKRRSLLRHDVGAAERVICCPLEPLAQFAEDDDGAAGDQVFREFNTLSVVYGRPAASFVEASRYHSLHTGAGAGGDGAEAGGSGAGGEAGGGGGAAPADEATGLLEADLLSLDDDAPAGGGAGGSGGGGGGGAAGSGGGAAAQQLAGSLLDLDLGYAAPQPAAAPPAAAPAAAPPAAAAAGPISLDSLLDGGGGGAGGLGALAPAAPSAPALSLAPGAKLAPAAFQEKWRRLPAARASTRAADAHRDFCAHAARRHIQTMACGGQAPGPYKFYMYGQDAASGALALVEMVVQVGAGGGAPAAAASASVTVKAEAPALAAPFAVAWDACLDAFCAGR